MCALIAPLLLFPGRLFAVYWYVPLIGAAILLASVAESRRGAAVTAVFLALWLPWDFVHFRELRRLNEREEQRYRTYVAEIRNCARLHPDQRLFVWDYLPDGFSAAGVTGALECVYRTRDVAVHYIDDPGADELIQRGDAVWLRWNRVFNRLDAIRYARIPQPAPYLVMNSIVPAGQLVSGWFRLEGDIRWTRPDAYRATIPPGPRRKFRARDLSHRAADRAAQEDRFAGAVRRPAFRRACLHDDWMPNCPLACAARARRDQSKSVFTPRRRTTIRLTLAYLESP